MANYFTNSEHAKNLAIGRDLARTLNLKKDKKDHFTTDSGTKSETGLGATVRRMVDEEYQRSITGKKEVTEIMLHINGNLLVACSTFAEANKVMRKALNMVPYFSDIIYAITWEDGYTMDGSIDCEPRSHFNGEKNPLTRHLKTFFGNVSQGDNSIRFTGFSDAELIEVREFVINYMFADI